jgi:hypothetical protein
MLNTFDDTDMELIANYYDVDLGDKTLIKVDVCKTGEGFLWFCKKHHEGEYKKKSDSLQKELGVIQGVSRDHEEHIG